jgi:hypothetical protein
MSKICCQIAVKGEIIPIQTSSSRLLPRLSYTGATLLVLLPPLIP